MHKKNSNHITSEVLKGNLVLSNSVFIIHNQKNTIFLLYIILSHLLGRTPLLRSLSGRKKIPNLDMFMLLDKEKWNWH